MKPKSFFLLGAIVFVVAFVSATGAQTTLRGPYYPIPSWDQHLSGATRFIVLSDWGGAAVLDRETGLVWEQTPSAGTTHFTWTGALEYCGGLSVANRMGWRLPTLQELTSLIDTSVTTFPTLPVGNPFQGVQPTYWSATTHPEMPTLARGVSFSGGNVIFNGDKPGSGYAWCVRGGAGVEAQ